MKCYDHGQMCSLVCNVKDCYKKLLCNQCMPNHNAQHYQYIVPIQDIEYQISQVPQLIEKDLDKLRQKLYAIQNHVVLEKDNVRKQLQKMIDVLKSRLVTELDEFGQQTLNYTKQYYASYESSVGEVLSTLADHLRIIAPYATRVRPLGEAQFQTLLEFQEKMLTNVMPALNSKVEMMTKSVYEDNLQMRIDNFYAIFKTHLQKVLQVHNLFNNNENQFKKSSLRDIQLDIPTSRSQVLDLNREEYKSRLATRADNNYSVVTAPISAKNSNLPKIQSQGELHSNYIMNTILTGHTDIITCMCLFTKSQMISGGGGGCIKIWDLDSGMCLGTLTEHAGDVWALAKINQVHFASASNDKTVRIWNINKMASESLLIGHLESVRALIYLRDIDILASAGMDMTIRLWNAGRARIKMTIQDMQRIKCLTYVEIKGLLLAGGDAGSIKVYNVLNGYCRDHMAGHQGEVLALQHLQDTYNGEQVSLAASSGIDRKIIIWNVDKAIKLHIFIGHTDQVNALAYDQLNSQLWSGGSDRTLRLWDLVKQKCILQVKRHSEQISCILYHRDLIITGSWDHRIRVTARTYFFS